MVHPNGQVYCETSGQCLASQYVCDGIPQCDLDCNSGDWVGWNDELPDRCDNCSDPELFLCQDAQGYYGIDRCIPRDEVSNGISYCGHWTDELATNCNNCSGQDTLLFRCMYFGLDSCIPNGWVCDGFDDCDFWEDEDAEICNDCEAEDLFQCEDRSRCINQQSVCNNIPECLDTSDEYNCSYDNTTMVSCPGLPDYLIPETSMCDGNLNCPDWSDELVVNCDGSCKGYLSFVCADLSFCVRDWGSV